MKSHSIPLAVPIAPVLALTLAFQSSCNAIPRNSMIMQGIPIANAWQTPWRFAMLLSSLCGRSRRGLANAQVYAWQSLCETKRMLGEDTVFARYHSMLSAVLSLRGVEGRILRHELSR